MKKETRKPNIILIVEDHHAYYGHEQNFDIKRPNFDKLVKKGINFSKAYCSAPLCCPSRRTMVTGLFPCNHGQINNQADKEFDRETYMEGLKKSGYDLFSYGKWHAGKGSPKDFGMVGEFGDDYGNPYLMPGYQRYLSENNLPFPKAYVEHNWCTPGWIDDINEDEEYILKRETMNECISGILETPKETHEAFYLAHEAVGRLEKLKETENPFFLRVDFWGPHQPYLPTKEYADLYNPDDIPEYPSFRDNLAAKPDVYRFEGGKGISDDYRIFQPNPMPWKTYAETLSRCYGQITMVDEAAGQILDKIDELGMAENTLIIWTADHGDGIACHGGHFDKDAYLAEEVLRIPFGLRFDGHVPQNRISTDLISNVDIAPTILGAAGESFDQNVDGRNILDDIANNNREWRMTVYAETFGHHFPHRGQMITDGRFKYIKNKDQINELYDLENDIYEMNNLIFDSAYDEVQKLMEKSLTEEFERIKRNEA